jgi:hypothetical protein
MITKTFKDTFIIGCRRVVVFRLIGPIIRDIEVDAVVAGLGNDVFRRLDTHFRNPNEGLK